MAINSRSLISCMVVLLLYVAAVFDTTITQLTVVFH
uniref:Uncharacterized protein n=1 Tax=Ackermannviridae sp. TaxID=2831612 RepID=A0A8S5VLP7_9CAUD|nr:MAG TPA: hypothetical protein [Ackermannviridae sp.]